jgi:DNA-binding CsgD family transcriptional regulator
MLVKMTSEMLSAPPQQDLLAAIGLWARRQPVSIEAWDTGGRALFVNPAWRNLWQMPDNVLVGSGYSILRDAQLHAKPVWEFLGKGFSDQVTVETPPSYYDPREEDGRPGRPRWTEGRIVPLWSGEDAFDEANGPVAFIILLHDVTQVVRTREKLAQVSEELQDGLRACARMKKRELLAWARGETRMLEKLDCALRSEQTPAERIASAPPPDAVLTPAEQRVVALLAEGYGPKEVGAVLGKSEKTIYTQCKFASDKLGLQSLSQLTVYACRWYGFR